MVDEETKMNDEKRWSDEILRRINASIDRLRDTILTSGLAREVNGKVLLAPELADQLEEAEEAKKGA